VSRSVNYKETWDFEFLLIVLKIQLENEGKSGSRQKYFIKNRGLDLNRLHREVGCTYLLSDAASFAFLYIRLSNLRETTVTPVADQSIYIPYLVQKLGLSGVHMSQDAANGATEVVLVSGGKSIFACFLSPSSSFCLALGSHLLCDGLSFFFRV
jgi:hypothetical protein